MVCKAFSANNKIEPGKDLLTRIWLALSNSSRQARWFTRCEPPHPQPSTVRAIITACKLTKKATISNNHLWGNIRLQGDLSTILLVHSTSHSHKDTNSCLRTMWQKEQKITTFSSRRPQCTTLWSSRTILARGKRIWARSPHSLSPTPLITITKKYLALLPKDNACQSTREDLSTMDVRPLTLNLLHLSSSITCMSNSRRQLPKLKSTDRCDTRITAAASSSKTSKEIRVKCLIWTLLQLTMHPSSRITLSIIIGIIRINNTKFWCKILRLSTCEIQPKCTSRLCTITPKPWAIKHRL